MKCEWVVKKPDESEVKKLINEFNIPELMARILVNRGIKTLEDVRFFLNPKYEYLLDPFLMKDMEKAVEVLLKIHALKEPVVVYGDYDVDGVTGTYLLCKILKDLGWEIDYYIPNRFEEGYGLSIDAIKEIEKRGFKNIITVDCGITSIEEVKYAKTRGFKVIITDHHEPKEVLPPADAVVNPKRSDDTYPFKNLAGVGVVFKLLNALNQKLGFPVDLRDYVDIVSVGTIADIVPLLHENRIIVKEGLKKIQKTSNVGLKKLIEAVGIYNKNITAHDVGFRLAPKLNAAGRIDSAGSAVDLLLCTDENKAQILAKQLVEQNSTRQSIENQIFSEALKIIKENGYENDRAIVVSREDWHPGVIGIVASRILGKFYKPTLLISIDSDGMGKGSARSIESINLMELLSCAEDLFEEFGGHPMAAGFTVKAENIPKLRERLNKKLKEYSEDLFTQKIEIDSELLFEEINDSLIEMIDIMRPFGQGNREPKFLFRNLHVEQIRFSGNSSEHLRMIIRKGDKKFEAFGFNLSPKLEDFKYVKPSLLKVDMVGSIKKYESYGMTHVSIAVEDILFYVDPIFEDNERDRNFVFELVKNWRKNTDDSSEEIDSEEVFLESQKYLSMKHREIYSILEKNPNVLLVYSNPKVKLTTMINKISKNLIENKRTLILSPINSNLSQTFKVLNRFFQNRMSYLNSMPNEISKDSKILFSTVTYISDEPDILKTFDTIFLDEPYYFYGLKNSSKDVSKVIELLHSWLKDGKELYLLGMQYSNETIKFFEKLFSPQFVIKEAVKKKELGLIDSRNVKDKLKYIKNTIRENGSVIVITSSPSNSVNLVKNLGNELIDIFKNGEIVFYNEFLKLFQMKKIENLLKKNRIRVLISTSSITDLNIEYDNVNIIFYDAPKIPQEMLLPIHAIDGKRSLITHMTFGKEDIEKNLEFLDSIFPSKKKIMEVYEYAVKYQKEGWEKIKEALVKDKIIESDSYFKIYQNIFSELGLLNNGKIKNLNPSEIPKSKRYREGILEKVVVNSFSKKLSESSPRDLLKIITISGGR